MSTPESSPPGPLPPSVYRRRRILVALGVVAAIVIIILLIARPGSGTPNPNPSDSTPAANPSTSASPHATPHATAAAGDPSTPCDPGDIQLVAVTDADSYAANVNPKLSMTITNTGDNACTLDVGTSAQEYLITSGADRIWDSKDCQTGATSTKAVLEPGKANSTTPFAWNRTRSSTTTCASTNLPKVTAGGASYHLAVLVGTLKSPETKQFILK